MTEIDYQKDVREPVFVRCRSCEHEWIGMYMPMHITRAASILQGLRCPNCADGSASIFIKAKEEPMAKWGEIKCPRCEELEAKLAQQGDLVKQMNDARCFPANTCGASRHAAMIAEALCSGEDYPMLAEEPDHCGESIAATVAALWECRTKLAQQDDLVQAAVAAALREVAHLMPRHHGVWSSTGVHIGIWDDGAIAAKVLGECPGGVMRDLIDMAAILALIPEDAQAALDRVVAAERERGFWAGRSCGGSKAEIDAALAAIRKGGE